MDATVKYDFTASLDDELSVKKGDKVLVVSMEGKHWYKAEHRGRQGYVPNMFLGFAKHIWFQPELSRQQAEAKLLEKKTAGIFVQKDGAFFLRQSETSPGDFTLSVKFGDQVQHFKVLRDGEGRFFLWVVKFDSLNDLVRYHRSFSVSRTQTIYLCDQVTSHSKL